MMYLLHLLVQVKNKSQLLLSLPGLRVVYPAGAFEMLVVAGRVRILQAASGSSRSCGDRKPARRRTTIRKNQHCKFPPILIESVTKLRNLSNFNQILQFYLFL